MNVICPHCKNENDFSPYQIKQVSNEFFCLFCGELSFFTPNKQKLVIPTEKERNEYFENDVDDLNFLPVIEKKDIRFNISTYDKGEWNDKDENFYEAERYFLMMFLKFGIIPQVGDIIRPKQKKGKMFAPEFVVISREWALDDYEELIIIVTPKENYFKLFN